ncbi:hypothetical protein Q3G72_026798 [Acer saccharum]|nr:hypothetical protein Q3G72_026798 [Acer saccharum]
MVRDIYLSPKSRFRRSCFAFVRFATREEANKVAMLMNGMHVYGWPISSKVASLDWSNRKKPSREWSKKPKVDSVLIRHDVKKSNGEQAPFQRNSYAEVVKGVENDGSAYGASVKDRVEVLKWDEDSYSGSWLKYCAVGVLKSFTDIHPVIKGLVDNRIHSTSFYLGDKNILWIFNSTKDWDSFIKNRFLWEDHFSSVGHWSNAITPQSRLSWVEFRGIPLNCCCKEFFMRLGWAVGEPFLIEDETLNREQFTRGRVLVLIPFGVKFPYSSIPVHFDDRQLEEEDDRSTYEKCSCLNNSGVAALNTLINSNNADLEHVINVKKAQGGVLGKAHSEFNSVAFLDKPNVSIGNSKSTNSKGKGILAADLSGRNSGLIIHNRKKIGDKHSKWGVESVRDDEVSESSFTDDSDNGHAPHLPIWGGEPDTKCVELHGHKHVMIGMHARW